MVLREKQNIRAITLFYILSREIRHPVKHWQVNKRNTPVEHNCIVADEDATGCLTVVVFNLFNCHQLFHMPVSMSSFSLTVILRWRGLQKTRYTHDFCYCAKFIQPSWGDNVCCAPFFD